MNVWKYDNYIFDLYGTLIDVHTDEHCEETWNKWCAWLDEHGYKHPAPMEFNRQFFERDAAHRKIAKLDWGFEVPEIDVINVYRELFLEYGNDAELCTNEKLNEASFEFRRASYIRIALFEGVPEFLDKIRAEGKHAYLLSNAQRSYTWPEIERFGLDKKMDDLFISSDHRCMKPDKAFFEALLNKYNMDRTRTVMIGDNPDADIAGAESVNIASIHLKKGQKNYKFYVDNLKTPWYIITCSQLKRFANTTKSKLFNKGKS